jgi:hypothetical protein
VPRVGLDRRRQVGARRLVENPAPGAADLSCGSTSFVTCANLGPSEGGKSRRRGTIVYDNWRNAGCLVRSLCRIVPRPLDVRVDQLVVARKRRLGSSCSVVGKDLNIVVLDCVEDLCRHMKGA